MYGPTDADVNTIVNMSLIGKLSVASWGLWLEAIGQAGLYRNLPFHLPFWAILAPLFLPWLTVYTISFCKVPPFGPRPFRNCLLFAVCLYVLLTMIAEASITIIHPSPQGPHFPIIAAQVLTCVGALSFIVLIPAYLSLRRLDAI
jgi:hypothetical protein